MESRKYVVVGLILAGITLSACVSKTTDNNQYSGYLGDYRNLQPANSPSGPPVLRWVAKDFKPDTYTTVVFDHLNLYPQPTADDRVDMRTFVQLQQYATHSVHTALSRRYHVLDSWQAVPQGARALVMFAAITGVSASNEGMHWYEVVPVAAVVGGVSAAIGQRDQVTELYVEAFLMDASTGKTVAKVVRKVFGKTLENSSQAINASDFDLAIDGMANDLSIFLK